MTYPDWVQPIAETIQNNDSKGGFFVVFPEYRPDQFVALSQHLGLKTFDYRSEVMSRLGWNADQLSLDDLDTTLHNLATKRVTTPLDDTVGRRIEYRRLSVTNRLIADASITCPGISMTMKNLRTG